MIRWWQETARAFYSPFYTRLGHRSKMGNRKKSDTGFTVGPGVRTTARVADPASVPNTPVRVT